MGLLEDYIHGLSQVEFHYGPSRDVSAWSRVTSIENWDLVTDVYQKAQPGQPTVGKKIVNFTQHCEITLALNMLSRRTQTNAKQKIEIGVSKACCSGQKFLAPLRHKCATNKPQNRFLGVPD